MIYFWIGRKYPCAMGVGSAVSLGIFPSHGLVADATNKFSSSQRNLRKAHHRETLFAGRNFPKVNISEANL